MGSVAQQCNTNTFIVQSIIGMQIQIWVLSIQCVAVNVMPDKLAHDRQKIGMFSSGSDSVVVLDCSRELSCHVLSAVKKTRPFAFSYRTIAKRLLSVGSNVYV